MSNAEKRNPWVTAALVVLGVLVLATILAILVAVFNSEDAEASAPYNGYAQAIAQNGSVEYSYAAADGRITYGAGGSKCDKVRNLTTFSSFGQRTFKAVLVTAWCWNGNRVTEVSNYPECNVTGFGATVGLEFDQCGKWGFYKPFHGHDKGAFEAHMDWSTKQVLCLPVVGCWTTPVGNTDGHFTTNVFSNGGFSRKYSCSGNC